ncbi:unnamed protein product, partial [Larinioides sclopetarius]
RLTSFQLQQRILFKHCGLFAGGKVNGCLASFSRQRNSFASERVLMNRRRRRFRKLAAEDLILERQETEEQKFPSFLCN